MKPSLNVLAVETISTKRRECKGKWRPDEDIWDQETLETKIWLKNYFKDAFNDAYCNQNPNICFGSDWSQKCQDRSHSDSHAKHQISTWKDCEVLTDFDAKHWLRLPIRDATNPPMNCVVM